MTRPAGNAAPLTPARRRQPSPSAAVATPSFSALVRRHLAPVLVCALLGGAVAAAVAVATARSSAAVLLALRAPAGGTVEPRDTGTESGLLVSPPVLDAAAVRLRLEPGELRERLSVDAPEATTWTVRYQAEDDEAADTGVQTVVDAYLQRRREEPDEATAAEVVTVAREPAGSFAWDRLIIYAVVGEAVGLLAALAAVAGVAARRRAGRRRAAAAEQRRQAGGDGLRDVPRDGLRDGLGPRDALSLTEQWLARPGPAPRILCLLPRSHSPADGDRWKRHVGASGDALAAALSERGHRVVVLDARSAEGLDVARLAAEGDRAARGSALRRRLPSADVVLVELSSPGSPVGRFLEGQADGVLLLGGSGANGAGDTGARQPAELTLLDGASPEHCGEGEDQRDHSDHSDHPGDRDRQASRERGSGRWASALREVLVVVGVAVALSWLLKTFVVQPFYIPSESMERTLLVGDRILAEKLTLLGRDFDRGDVVVFVDPGGWLAGADERASAERGPLRRGLEFVGLLPADTGDDLVKRVIGVEGDRVVCCDDRGRVTVNGAAVTEPYLFRGDAPSDTAFDVRVPAGHLWVMGDHRSFSQDSRFHQDDPSGGSIPVDAVVGRVVAVVWPFERAGGVGSGQ